MPGYGMTVKRRRQYCRRKSRTTGAGSSFAGTAGAQGADQIHMADGSGGLNRRVDRYPHRRLEVLRPR